MVDFSEKTKIEFDTKKRYDEEGAENFTELRIFLGEASTRHFGLAELCSSSVDKNIQIVAAKRATKSGRCVYSLSVIGAQEDDWRFDFSFRDISSVTLKHQYRDFLEIFNMIDVAVHYGEEPEYKKPENIKELRSLIGRFLKSPYLIDLNVVFKCSREDFAA